MSGASHIGTSVVFGNGVLRCLDYRVEVLYVLPSHLMKYVVDDSDAFGQASLRR